MGEEGKLFFLHREAVSDMSPAFKTMVNETNCEYLMWPEVRVDTFVSFAQFAYTGDYAVTRHETDGDPVKAGVETEIESESESDSESDPERVVIIYGRPVESRLKERSVKKRSYDMMVFDELPTSPRSNKEKYLTMTYSAIFLGHARLHALATKYGAENLQKLALRNIKYVLNHFSEIDIYPGCEDSIAKLVEYAFSDSNYPGEVGHGLRKVLLRFVKNKFHWLGWCEGFWPLLESGGVLAANLLAELVEQLEPNWNPWLKPWDISKNLGGPSKP